MNSARLFECVVVLALGACANQPERAAGPAPDVASAQAIVAITCVDKVPAGPALLSEGEWAKSTVDEDMRVRVLKVDRRRLLEHVKQLEAAIAACVDAPTAAAPKGKTP